MPVQVPQWSEYLSCPVCQNEFEVHKKPPVSLACGHTACRTCLQSLQRRQCPFDQTPIKVELASLPINTALLQLVGNGEVPEEYRQCPVSDNSELKEFFTASTRYIEELALFLKPAQSSQLSRPIQRKLVTLINCQLLEQEGQTRAARAARSLGERSVTELILQHQNPQQLSANLWAAVRARGCQFLGPAMQEEVLNFVLMALDDGSALSRKVLVMFVVQRLEQHFPQASKTSIGHVVQLLYRASCFKVTKRDGDSSLMQLKEEFRTYETLRREHDTQIVQIATEAGLRIAPDQWSSLLYGDSAHKSHMQSIIDKLQTPQSFSQSVQELVIALQRTGDPGRLSILRPQLDVLSSVDPNPESEAPDWQTVLTSLQAAREVVAGLVNFSSMNGNGSRKTSEGMLAANSAVRYKTSMCRDLSSRGSCPRGHNCTFAHSQQELEIHRGGAKKPKPARETMSSIPDVNNKGQPMANIFPRQKSKFGDPAEVKPFTPSVSCGSNPPVAQVAPIPRIISRDIIVPEAGQVQQIAPLVDMNGSPVVDVATGQPLVAASPLENSQVQVFQAPVHIAGVDGGLYAVQPGTPIQLVAGVQVGGGQTAMLPQAAAVAGQTPTQVVQLPPMNVGTGQAPTHVLMQNNAMMPAHENTNIIMQNAIIHQHTPSPAPSDKSDIKMEMPENMSSKSLSALKDRKEEILSELGNIVGTSAANVIGDIAIQQADKDEKFPIDLEPPTVPRTGSNTGKSNQVMHKPQQQQQQQPQQIQQEHHHHQDNSTATYGMWTSKPLVTMSSLFENNPFRSPPPEVSEEDLHPLPEGAVVSRFGPISRKLGGNSNKILTNTEPRAVTAALGMNTRPTSIVRQPLAVTSPVPENLLPLQDHNSILQYDPGCFTDWHGFDSVAMNHLVNPPIMPVSPLPNPKDPNTSNVNNRNLSMYAESARIQKELFDLQRRISCLSVVENNNQLAMKRDRLAIELRMIESGIRERHNEIRNNKPEVEGRHVTGHPLHGHVDHPTHMLQQRDHVRPPSSSATSTQYTYW